MMYRIELQAFAEGGRGVRPRPLMLLQFRRRNVTQNFRNRRRDRRVGLFVMLRFVLLLLLRLLLFLASVGGAFQLFVEDHVLQFDPLRVFPRGLVDVISRVCAEEPTGPQRKLHRLTAPGKEEEEE